MDIMCHLTERIRKNGHHMQGSSGLMQDPSQDNQRQTADKAELWDSPHTEQRCVIYKCIKVLKAEESLGKCPSSEGKLRGQRILNTFLCSGIVE